MPRGMTAIYKRTETMKEHYNEQVQTGMALYGAEAALYARMIVEMKETKPMAEETGMTKAQPLPPTRPQA